MPPISKDSSGNKPPRRFKKKSTPITKKAFGFDDRYADKSNLKSEFSSSSKSKPSDALEMGEGYTDGGKNLPTVKKEGKARRPLLSKQSCDNNPGNTKEKTMRGNGRPTIKRKRMQQTSERSMKPMAAEDDDFMPELEGEDMGMEDMDLEELDFGDLPELGEEEIEEVSECPPGCVPEAEAEEDEEEDEEEEEGEEEDEEEEGGEEEEEEEEEDADKKEAMVFVLAEDQFDHVDSRDLDFPIFDPEGENPHYLVLHQGEPVAKIALQDQPLPEDHRGPFLAEKYTHTLRNSIDRVGLADTLSAVHAKIYAAQGYKSKIANEMKTAAKADMDQAFKVNMANLQDNLLNTITLAIDASVKNVLLENPLKESLVLGMRKAGVSERGAVEIIEHSFRDKGPEYFQSLMHKAEEWMGMNDESQRQIAAMVSTSNYVHPADRMSDYSFEDEEELNEGPETVDVVPRNVPVRAVASQQEHMSRRTASTNESDDSAETLRNELRGRLRLGSRMVKGGRRD